MVGSIILKISNSVYLFSLIRPIRLTILGFLNHAIRHCTFVIKRSEKQCCGNAPILKSEVKYEGDCQHEDLQPGKVLTFIGASCRKKKNKYVFEGNNWRQEYITYFQHHQIFFLNRNTSSQYVL